MYSISCLGVKCAICLVLLLCVFGYDCVGQKVVHNIQLNGGLISQSEADIYVGKLNYIPEWKVSDAFRVGVNAGTFYTRKSFEGSAGINALLRLKNFSVLNDNFSVGGIYLRASHEWGTSSEKILSGALVFELPQIALNVSYGRDFHFDQNWINYGFSILLVKSQPDDDE